MPDYGHDLIFGTHITPVPERLMDGVKLGVLTEEVGLDLATLSDHPYWPGQLDVLAVLSYIAARTTTIKVAANLFNLPLRGPAVLARTAASLDVLSGGRFELGVATGAQQMWDEIVAEGGARLSPGESIDALIEAVQIIRALWTPGEPMQFEGRHYRMGPAQPGPFAVHDMSIWVGAYQPRLLRVTGQIADGWLPSSPFLPPERLPAANQLVDEGAVAAGRDPAAVRRLYNIAGEFSGTPAGFLRGPAEMWIEQLADLALNQGMSAFMLYRTESGDIVRQFAAEVAPAVRELVKAERQ